MTFSRRMGLKPEKALQVDDMDDALRISIWNCLFAFSQRLGSKKTNIKKRSFIKTYLDFLTESIWLKLLKLPVDELEAKFPMPFREFKDYFMGCAWYEAYDFLEFVVNAPVSQRSGNYYSEFIGACNDILEIEQSSYRIVDKKIVRVTIKHEIAAIEDALAATNTPTGLTLVNTHLNQALAHLADRHNHDYRNSIKESISAVECLCKLIADKPKAELGPALDAIKKSGKVSIHPALEEGFKKLYGYTSDSEGIRHALKDEPTVDVEDARYMLVMCAGFVSYLIEKARKAGIAL